MNRYFKMFGLGLLALVAVGIAVGFVFRAELSARYTAYQLRNATDAESRKRLAEELISRGSASTISDLMKSDSPEIRTVVIDAASQLSIGDPHFTTTALAILDAIPQLDDANAESALALAALLANVPATAERAKAAVECALKAGTAAKVAACRVATRPGIDLATAVVPLLADADANVRQAAVIAIGPVSSLTVVSEEELFKLLSDTDADVRTVTAAALSTRGLDDRQIELGRKLMHSDVKERMSLLMDLKFVGDSLKDPGPWLARLGKDADPAVRAGAARVAFESRITTGDWLNELADRDPDPLVRQVAAHYRQRTNDVRTVGGVDR